MMLKKWDELPDELRTEEVRKYYDILKKKQTSLFFMSSASYSSVKVSENEYRVMSLFDAGILPGSKA